MSAAVVLLAVTVALATAGVSAAEAATVAAEAPLPRPGERSAEDVSPETLAALAFANSDRERSDRSGRYIDALRKATEAFSVVTPTLSPDEVALETFILNTEGQGIDALMFEVPPGEPRDFFWAFVMPKDLPVTWCIMSLSDAVESPGFWRWWPSERFAFEGVELPPDSAFRLQASVPDPSHGSLVSGEKYILWFDFSDLQPVTMQVAVCLPPRGSGVDERGSIAKMLGLKCAEIVGACELGQIDRVVAMLDADPTAMHLRVYDGQSLLHRAAYYDRPEVARLLLARGADVNATSNRGVTPLHMAVREEYMRMVDLLIANGADVNMADDDGRSVLHIAALEDYHEAVAPLVAAGADPRALTGTWKTALHLAAREDHEKVVEQLLAGGLDVDVTDADGRTALHEAARRGQEAMVRFLAARGADVNAEDYEGRTPADAAFEAGYTHTVAVLAALGARPPTVESEWIDLLKLVDPRRDAVAGEWTFRGGGLRVNRENWARISFPYEPPEAYDFAIDFTMSASYGCTAQLLSRGSTAFAWSMSSRGSHQCRIEDIDGRSGEGNPTRKRYHFEAGERYTSVVRVRELSITCLINDEVIAQYDTTFDELSRNTRWRLPNERQLGLGTWYGPTTFHRAVVRPVR
jgi:ankyrin repeat protein